MMRCNNSLRRVNASREYDKTNGQRFFFPIVKMNVLFANNQLRWAWGRSLSEKPLSATLST